jgi:hypothetical protein
MTNKAASKGRPQRWKWGRQQTRLWSEAVRVTAGLRDFHGLEEVLGADGKWVGLWSRYSRGAVSPMPDRILRIEAVLPGTARYFETPFWFLTENRPYTRAEIDKCAAFCTGPLTALMELPIADLFGRRRNDPEEARQLLVDAVSKIPSRKWGLDAVTAILVAIREAELAQDSKAYLAACQAWAVIENQRSAHPVLRYLSPRILEDVAEPLRTMRFFPEEVDEQWRRHVDQYCERKCEGHRSYEVLDCVLNLKMQPTCISIFA